MQVIRLWMNHQRTAHKGLSKDYIGSGCVNSTSRHNITTGGGSPLSLHPFSLGIAESVRCSRSERWGGQKCQQRAAAGQTVNSLLSKVASEGTSNSNAKYYVIANQTPVLNDQLKQILIYYHIKIRDERKLLIRHPAIIHDYRTGKFTYTIPTTTTTTTA